MVKPRRRLRQPASQPASSQPAVGTRLLRQSWLRDGFTVVGETTTAQPSPPRPIEPPSPSGRSRRHNHEDDGTKFLRRRYTRKFKVNPTWTDKIFKSNRPKLLVSTNSTITLAQSRTRTYNKNSFNVSLYQLSYLSFRYPQINIKFILTIELPPIIARICDTPLLENLTTLRLYLQIKIILRIEPRPTLVFVVSSKAKYTLPPDKNS